MNQPQTQQAFDIALQHHRAARLQQAEQIYQRILAEQPAHAGAIHYSGLMAHQRGRNGLALELIRRAISLGPDVPEAHNSLGVVLLETGQFPEAITALRQAVILRPSYANAHYNLGQTLKADGQLDEAIAAYWQAIALDPGFANTHNNLGNTLMELGRIDEAIAAYRQAVALEPNLPEAHYNLALALLARGDFKEGWDEHEWRWKCREFSLARRNLAQPLWVGSPLEDRTLLLHAEQGLGDTIQFIRYLPMIAQRGGKIIVECQPDLVGLLSTMIPTIDRTHPGICEFVPRGQTLPPFDVHCPLLSLPRAFNTTLQSTPAKVPYLFPDQSSIESWRRRLCGSGTKRKIGLAWAGSPSHKSDRTRSISLDRLTPLANLRDVQFYSLQKGPTAAQAKSPPSGMDLVDWTEEFSGFNDAALIANLDLVITVDTAIAHLAGALNRPTWVLLSFVPDWRWLLDRNDSPWYPSMRVFRQPTRGDWDSVIAQVVEALSFK